jgi:catechol 2,3-dioxygenase-like lactoylglutathione lyase family enzyme
MATRLVYGRIAATIAVTDMARALHFYTELLGLEKQLENGEPVRFAIVGRDAAELHLVAVPAAELAHAGSRHAVAHLLISDARALHDRLATHGVRIVKPLRDAPYGLRDFIFADPDGNRIDVGERL